MRSDEVGREKRGEGTYWTRRLTKRTETNKTIVYDKKTGYQSRQPIALSLLETDLKVGEKEREFVTRSRGGFMRFQSDYFEDRLTPSQR